MDIYTGVMMKIHDVTRLISEDMTVYKDRESKKKSKPIDSFLKLLLY